MLAYVLYSAGTAFLALSLMSVLDLCEGRRGMVLHYTRDFASFLSVSHLLSCGGTYMAYRYHCY